MHVLLLIVGFVLLIAGVFNLAHKDWLAAIVFLVAGACFLGWGGFYVG